MDDLSIQVGKRLVEMRLAKGKNQSYVARQLGTIPSTVAKWESGVSSPSAFFLLKLADFYGCTTDEILGRTKR